MNMSRRRDIDFSKYTKLDTEDDVIFFGPITKRELLRSVEVEEEVVRRRIAKKKAEAAEKKILEADKLRREGNTDDELNRTFEILEAPCVLESEKRPPLSNNAPRTLQDVTQLHLNYEEAPPLLDLSVQFSRTSMKLPNPKPAKFLLDETINFNESKIGAYLPTPLCEKTSKSKNVTVTRKRSDIASKENRNENMEGTPRLVKLSDTFITDMMEEDVLNATIPDDAGFDSKTVERVGTPDIFKQKRNGIWKNSSETKKNVGEKLVQKNKSVKNSTLLFSKSPATTVGTKLPTRVQTPVRNRTLFHNSPAISRASSSTKVKNSKPLFTKSPISEYIHRGLEIQSMSKVSKARHGGCTREFDDRRSKSDNKIVKNCKIPVSIDGNAKRKLDLEK